MALKLDKKDRKILSELDMDARQPLTALAKKVGLSREVVNYRIQQMEKKKIITGYSLVLDTSRLGLLYCRVFIKYRKMPRDMENGLLEFCKGDSRVGWIILGEGKWDVVLVVLAKSLAQIELLQDELMNRFGSFFQNPYLSLMYRVHEFKHNYLYSRSDDQELVVGGNSVAELDSRDYMILDALSENAQMTLVELSKSTGLDPHAVRVRMQRMMDKKVILAYRARINTSLLGYDYYKVFMLLQTADQDVLKRIHSFLRQHKNVIYITKPMGAYTLEFEAMVSNANELHDILAEFKRNFGDVLLDYDTYFTYEVIRARYLPKKVAKRAVSRRAKVARAAAL